MEELDNCQTSYPEHLSVALQQLPSIEKNMATGDLITTFWNGNYSEGG